MKKHGLIAICCGLALISLTGCESVQHDVNTSFAGITAAFSNFHPFDAAPGNGAATQTAATRNDYSFSSAASAGPNCPDVHIVQDLNQIHQFNDSGKATERTAVSDVRMLSVDTRCKTGRDGVTVDMTIAFEGDVGPEGRKQSGDSPSFAYPYFVAITDRAGRIIGKEVFAVTLDYDKKSNHIAHTEQIRQVIPSTGSSYKNDKVLIGFQLSDQELAYNRSLPPEEPTAIIEPAAGPKTRAAKE